MQISQSDVFFNLVLLEIIKVNELLKILVFMLFVGLMIMIFTVYLLLKGCAAALNNKLIVSGSMRYD